ncbi:MAG: hypothetical protein H0T75_06305 [Rhizobiales bacterium]|jgi:hypothetical protein|nr:hypothetical protein [Hyphomicrobiales bacterium]
MNNFAVKFGIAGLALGASLLSVPALAEERVCRGTIGATTLDNVRVPQNATCVLNRTRVKGTITVQSNARLFASGVVVIGNVQGENARNVVVDDGSRVGGSVQVVQGLAATVADSRIDGSIQTESNDQAIRVLRNRVGSDVQAFQNTGGVQISRNVIDGNLQCKENRPRPTGGGNVVQGNKEDQCARL